MKKGFTEFVFVIDKSSSMRHLVEDTIKGFNLLLCEQQNIEGDAVVTTVLFDKHYEILHDRTDIKAIPPITDKDYVIGRGTAMLDAIGSAIHKIRYAQKHTKEEYQPENTIFIIMTDGEEYSSRKYDYAMIKERIEHYRDKHGWKFMFYGTNMDAVKEAAKIGISEDCAVNYAFDSNGISEAYSSMSAVSSSVRVKHAQNDAADVLKNLRNAARGLAKESQNLNEMVEAIKANDGDPAEMWRLMNAKGYVDKHTLQKYWSKDFVVVDDSSDIKQVEIPKSELRKGEISAKIFDVGFYTVRMSKRIYIEQSIGEIYELLPGDENHVADFIKAYNGKVIGIFPKYEGDVYNEVFVKCKNKSDRYFSPVCRTRVSKSRNWTEDVTAIFTAKENLNIDDKEASLIIRVDFVGTDYDAEKLYKVSPQIETEKLYLDSHNTGDNEKFEKINVSLGGWH